MTDRTLEANERDIHQASAAHWHKVATGMTIGCQHSVGAPLAKIAKCPWCGVVVS